MDRNIEKLRILCGSAQNNKNDPWCKNSLTPIECCEVLISGSSFYETLQSLPHKWITLAKVILPLTDESEKCMDTFKKLLTYIFENEELDGKQAFLNELWKYLETHSLQCNEILDDLATNSPEYLEVKVIGLFSEVLMNYQEDKELVVQKDLVKLCSKSSKVFTAVTSMMSEILLRVSKTNFQVFTVFLNATKEFVNSVSEMCQAEDLDFIDLYPWRYRGLVCLLRCGVVDDDAKEEEDEGQMGSSMKDDGKELRSACIEWILPVMVKRLNEDAAGMFALLVHYSTWLPYLHS